MAWNRLSNYATTISHDGNYNQVIYHSTVIVKWDNDAIILNSGGWETVTTKRKMNQTAIQFKLGFQVYQEDYTWYVTYKNKTVPFQDRMILDR